jgi:peroxiredoxin
VASVDDQSESQKTQTDFPHLTVIADPGRSLCSAFDVLQKGAGPKGEDVAGPTTFLIDRQGVVRWVFRPDRFITRLTPAQLLAAVDQHVKPGTE